jgi:hypothetical protein
VYLDMIAGAKFSVAIFELIFMNFLLLVLLRAAPENTIQETAFGTVDSLNAVCL